MTLQRRNSIISVILAIVIIVLGWFLYRSIVKPYNRVQKQQRLTAATRLNMVNIRTALIHYQFSLGHFPPSEGGLDSLMSYLRSDTLSLKLDSLMKSKPEAGYIFSLDSLILSPRPPHKRFIYILNDTLKQPTYILKDPDTTSNDHIGSLTNSNLLNTKSW